MGLCAIVTTCFSWRMVQSFTIPTSSVWRSRCGDYTVTDVRLNAWINYVGTACGGPRWCELDAVVVFPDRAVVVESKLTQRGEVVWAKLAQLYRPLTEYLLERPVCVVQAFKNASQVDRHRLVRRVGELAELEEDAIWQIL